MIRRMAGVLAGAAVVALGGCAAVADGSIATFTHDLGGPPTLRAYPPEPAEVTRQGEDAANRLYGVINTRSPRTPYFCGWRDTGASGFRRQRSGPPGAILLMCAFGTSPWAPPPKLVDYATEAARRDEALVKIGWTRREGKYVMNAFEVRIRNLDAGRSFRSVWSGAEVARIALRDVRIALPSSPDATLRFAFTAAIPRRTNFDEPASAPTVKVSVTGSAPPLPEWVLY